jgi:hypothetical protein
MYSVVLMMAVTTGGDVPDLGHRRHGCCGGGGCCGGYVSGCYGGGCFGGACYGGGGGCCGGRTIIYGGGGCCGGYMMQGGMYMQRAPEGIEKKPEKKDKEEGMSGSAPVNQARLVVNLPAGSRLLSDSSRATAPTQRVMTFMQMSPNSEVTYIVQGEVTRGGQVVRVDRPVTLRGGSVTEVTLGESAVSEAAADAR